MQTSVLLLIAVLGCATTIRLTDAHELAGMQTPDDKLIAIDILLEPDQTMIAKARAVNARLRGNYPAGYELDATHAPHVTLLQRFVRAKDFDAVTAAVSKVLAAERPADLQLNAKAVDYVIWGGLAVTVLDRRAHARTDAASPEDHRRGDTLFSDRRHRRGFRGCRRQCRNHRLG